MEATGKVPLSEAGHAIMDRARFLRLFIPAAERLSNFLGRLSASRPRKNAYDLFFAVLRRLHIQIPLYSQTFFGQRMHILLPEFGSCTVVENGMLDLQTPLYLAAVLRAGDVCLR